MRSSRKTISLSMLAALGLVALIGLSSCSTILDLLGLGPATGRLKVRAYNQAYAADTTAIDNSTIWIDAILDVTYPDGTKDTVVTDHLGYYNFGEVDEGDYLIVPRYCEASVGRTFTVEGGESCTGSLTIPDIGLYYYILNPAQAPLDSLAVRQALCLAINREEILVAANGPTVPAYSTIPATMAGDWYNAAHAMYESVDEANAALGAAGALALDIIFNVNTRHAAIAAAVQTDWQVLVGDSSSSVAVTLTSQAWDTYLATKGSNAFRVIRGGWILDSNNLLPFYDMISTHVTAQAYADLLAAARVQYDARDFEAYETGLVAINDYLVDNALILPMYCY